MSNLVGNMHMDTEKKKIKSFVDIIAWQEGHKLVL